MSKTWEALYKERSANAESVLRLLKEWCVNAEESGIEALEEEIDEVQTYDMTPEEFDSNTISLKIFP